MRAGQPDDDPNLRAYGAALDSVALGWRLAQADELTAGLPRGQVVRGPLILVVPATTARVLRSDHLERLLQLTDGGAVLVTEEITPLSEKLGFRTGAPVAVSQVTESAHPEVTIFWEHPGTVVALQPPAAASVLTREKASKAALAALLPYGRGHCVVLAAPLDPIAGEGYARFPFFIHALVRAGVTLPFRSERLSAYFDYGYRYSADPAGLAENWRRAGVRAVHAGAWAFWEPGGERDEYLNRLIAACHRNGILVYAWLELPYVSDTFWKQHPKWRDKTERGRDARIDFRLQMNLQEPDCVRAVEEELRLLLHRFDWDGVDLAELYFEHTPFNALARSEFKARHGIDPREFFRKRSRHYWKKDGANWATFVDYRVEQATLLTERFLKLLSDARTGKPHLGINLTYVDNISDPSMREQVGADIRDALALLGRYNITLVMEDPSTVWRSAPRRYSELARSYAGLTSETERLGVDINIVDRREESGARAKDRSYPADKQTGGEYLALFHHAGSSFQTVVSYAESTHWPWDLELVSHALASRVSGENVGDGLLVNTAGPITVRTNAKAADFLVDGEPWPCVSGGDLLLPPGQHQIRAAAEAGARRPRLVRLNGELLKARYAGDNAIEFSYRNSTRARAIVIFDRAPKAVRVDGVEEPGQPAEFRLLPPGSHTVSATF